MPKFKIQMTMSWLYWFDWFYWLKMEKRAVKRNARKSNCLSPKGAVWERSSAEQALFAVKRTLKWSKKDF